MARARAAPDRTLPARVRLPGLREGVPLLLIGSTAVALGVYSLISGLRYGPTHFPIWTYLVALGGIAFLGGTVTTIVGGTPPAVAEEWSLPADSVVVDRATWVRLSREVARYRSASPHPDDLESQVPDPPPGPSTIAPPAPASSPRAAGPAPSRRPRLFGRVAAPAPLPLPPASERRPATGTRASRFAGLMLAVGPAANQPSNRGSPAPSARGAPDPISEPMRDEPPPAAPPPEPEPPAPEPVPASASSSPPSPSPSVRPPAPEPPQPTAPSTPTVGPVRGPVTGEEKDSFDKLFLELGEPGASAWTEDPAPSPTKAPDRARPAAVGPVVCVGCGQSFVALDGQRCDACGLALCSACQGRSAQSPHPGLCPTCGGLLDTAASS